MLINGSHLLGASILSLHIGAPLARVTELIIDPNNLKLIALRVDGPIIGTEDAPGDLLPLDSVREFSRQGFIIDSADELVETDDIIHLKNILKLRFELVGLKVITKRKSKLGKVSDFILNTSNWEVYQLIVQRPIVKSLLDPELAIPRSQILEVDDYQVIVKDEHEKVKASAAPADFVPNFINPFREPDYAEKELPVSKS